ncbi:MAG TPA: Abi-alpha family protein [Bryobacteraceae bacterium]|nr:Abi-alpha family protein [Bryobacteraceae bacterium]
MSDVFGVGKAIEKLMDPVSELVKKLAGPAAEEVGLSLQDSVKVWRAKRQYRLFEKMNGFIADAGFEPNPVSLKTLLPALDYASVEDDETMHTAWAALLANASDPRNSSGHWPSFPAILKEITPREAKFLNALDGESSSPHFYLHSTEPIFTEDELKKVYVEAGLSRRPNIGPMNMGEMQEGGDDLQADLKDFAMVMAIVIRLGLLRLLIETEPLDVSAITRGRNAPRRLEISVSMHYIFTELARQFVRACRPPAKS